VPSLEINVQALTLSQAFVSGGTIFVDTASGKISVKSQVGISAAEMICSKMEYEHEALGYSRVIALYCLDNGTFSAHYFLEEIEHTHQKIIFSGAGVQH
jgi:hypothetical protein